MKKLRILMPVSDVLAGCNTFEGVRKDIQKAGESIEDAAKKK